MHTHKHLIVTAHTGLFREFSVFSALLLNFQMIACNLVRAGRFQPFGWLPLHLILVDFFLDFHGI